MKWPSPLLIFTDLDGTLLDHHSYSFEAAQPALSLVRQKGVPLVLCSSKTRAEMEPLWRILGLSAPFISENGGGIFCPREHPLAAEPVWSPAGAGWRLLALGMPIDELRRCFSQFKDQFKARGFGDMSDDEVAQLTGLDLGAAGRARQRDFNEPVLLPDPESQAEAFAEAARLAGLEVTRGGRFFHLLGGGDKGLAVGRLIEMFRRLAPGLITMALGDAPNDQAMLAQVDHPVLVARPDGGHAQVEAPGLVKAPGVGPQGWNQAVLERLDRMEGA